MAAGAADQDHVLAKPGKAAGPCAMVIFGASGDLTMRKLIPSLFNLAKAGLLPKDFVVVGTAHDDLTEEKFRTQVMQFLDAADRQTDMWNWFLHRLRYHRGSFDDAANFTTLAQLLKQLDAEFKTAGNYLFYLATAPKFFGPIVEQLGAAGLANEDQGNWRRVVIEKPFGTDLESAKALNAQIKNVLKESQIYRIDHYLGKETVQNIMVFRFDNAIFEPIWNRRYIDHVQITNAETVGVEQRGGYFDTAGTLRDMVPNHLMQLLSLIAMEPPISFQADAVRNEQAKVLHAIQPFDSEEVLQRTVRGQYGEGTICDRACARLSQRTGVSPESRTETFAAMKLNIDNWRWAGVPFYLRTGKRMAKRHTEIAIQFKRTPFSCFATRMPTSCIPITLVIQIQPDEGISLELWRQDPGRRSCAWARWT